MNPKLKLAFPMLLAFAMTIPYIGFVLYCATHYPSGQWPLWPRITLGGCFIAIIVIPTLVSVRMRRKQAVDGHSIAAVPLEGKLERKLAVACYLCGVLFPILFLISKPFKSNKFLRFHAFQAIILWAILIPLKVAGSYPWANLATLLWPVLWIVWLVLMVKAYQGKRFGLPLIGSIANRLSE